MTNDEIRMTKECRMTNDEGEESIEVGMRWMALVGCLVAVLVLGCDKPAQQASGTKAFRVAMILPGSDQDHGWNQMAREGLDRIQNELKAQPKIVTNVKTGEMANQLSYFGGEGFDVVICHGQEFASDVGKAAGRFPKTHFIVGGCPTDVPGAVAVEFEARDA